MIYTAPAEDIKKKALRIAILFALGAAGILLAYTFFNHPQVTSGRFHEIAGFEEKELSSDQKEKYRSLNKPHKRLKVF